MARLVQVVAMAGLEFTDPAPYECGGKTLGEALLTPTRIYVQLLLPLLRAGLVKALAHITGGGLPENIPRVLPEDAAVEIDLDACGWALPPVFQWLRQQTRLPKEELTRTFNCGVGMVLVVGADQQAQVLQLLADRGEDVLVLGRVAPRAAADAPQVVLSGEFR